MKIIIVALIKKVDLAMMKPGVFWMEKTTTIVLGLTATKNLELEEGPQLVCPLLLLLISNQVAIYVK